MKNKYYILIVILITTSVFNSLSATSSAPTVGDYVFGKGSARGTDGEWITAANWGILNADLSYTTPSSPPSAGFNTWIPSGYTVKTSSPSEDINAYDLHVLGTLILGNNLKCQSVYVHSEGILVSDLQVSNSSRTITTGYRAAGDAYIEVNGTLGTTSYTGLGKITVSMNVQKAINYYITGNGTIGLYKLSLAGGQADVAININIKNNITATDEGFIMAYLWSPEARTLNIDKGVTFCLKNGLFHFTSIYSSNPQVNCIYNINGKLDISSCSDGAFFITTSSTTSGSEGTTQKIQVNVGANGELKLPANLYWYKQQPTTQTLEMNVAEGGKITFAGSTYKTPTSKSETHSLPTTSFKDVEFTTSDPLNISDNLSIVNNFKTAASTLSGTGLISTGSTGAVTLNGTTAQSISSTNFTDGIVNKLIIDNSEGVSITNNLTANTVAINPGKALNINVGKTLTAAVININSDTTGTGTFINNGTATIVTANVQQYLPTYRSWYMTSPVVGTVTPIDENSNTPSLINYYNESTGTATTGWNASATMTSGKGYLINPANTIGSSTLTFTGTLPSLPNDIPLTSRIGTADKAGFNLIGNSSPAYLNWVNVMSNADNLALLRSTTMWYRTKTNGTYSYWTVNGDGIGSPSAANASIPPMQAFWVRANEGGGNLHLTSNMLSHAPTTDKLFKAPSTKNSSFQLLRIQVDNGINTDETVIYTSPKATNTLDKYDAPKIKNNNAAIPEIYTIEDTEQLVINALNTISENQTITLGFSPGQSKSFNIKATEISNFETGSQIFIHDNLTGDYTELNIGTSYGFNSDSIPTTSRFSILFRVPTIITDQSNTKLNRFEVSYTNGKLIINSHDKSTDKSIVSLYNITGQQLMTQTLKSNYTIINRSLTSGVYLINIKNNGIQSSQKVIIR